MWFALTQTKANPDKIIKAFTTYVEKEKNHITRKQFLRNMEAKMKEKEFLNDIEGLLRPGINFNQAEAYKIVKSQIIEKL